MRRYIVIVVMLTLVEMEALPSLQPSSRRKTLLNDFYSSTNRNKVFPGFPDVELIDPCVNNRCQNGRCTPQERNPDGYRCSCREASTGRFCEIAPTCVKFFYREYYVDHVMTCKSRTVVHHRRCLGSCRQFCMVMSRIYCPNSNHDYHDYHRDVTVMRTCGCHKCRKHIFELEKKVWL